MLLIAAAPGESTRSYGPQHEPRGPQVGRTGLIVPKKEPPHGIERDGARLQSESWQTFPRARIVDEGLDSLSWKEGVGWHRHVSTHPCVRIRTLLATRQTS